MIKTSITTLRETSRKEEIKDFVSVCSGLLALPLYLVFWIADLIYAPQIKWHALWLRLVMVPVCLVTNYVMRRYAVTLNRAQWIGLVFASFNSFVINSLVALTGESSSPYYAGLNLVCFGINTFVPWTRGFLIANVGLIYGPFLALSIPDVIRKKNYSLFVANCFFMIATVVISIAIRYFTERLRRKEVSGRWKLEQELTSRERIIRQKTDEGILLASLTTQFSPQIIHSIRSGQLDILSAVHLSEICTIFIDIVNSTDRVIKMEMPNINKVISMFMEDTMKVLLKYDITIDKFLGDGVLGFSNDPVPRKDFVERVVNAALEIRSRIASHHATYAQFWDNELQIRIGVDVGKASVGFYGSEHYVRSYTAIGRPVNLASRLCSVAEKNQVLVSEEVALRLTSGPYHLTPLGKRDLKGFGEGAVSVYAIDAQVPTLRETSAEIDVCPLNHGVLHLDTDERGIYILACRTCGYTQPPSVPDQKAVAA